MGPLSKLIMIQHIPLNSIKKINNIANEYYKEKITKIRNKLANSLVEWTSVFETFCVCLVVSKFSLFYTVQYGKVQYSTGIYLVPRYYSVV